MVPLRRVVGVLAVGTALVGCSPQASESGPVPPSSTSAAGEYDLARLAAVAKDLPPGFTPYPFEATELNPAFVGQVGAVVSYGKPFTVEPSECRALLKPVDGQSNARTNGVRADGPDGQSIAVNADAPVTVAAGVPPTGCDRMTFHVENDTVRTQGTAERMAAPAIDGATTEALRIQVDGATNVQYLYAAVLDDRLYVNVAARLNPESSVQPLLPGLLVTAVAALRGR